MSDRQPRQCHYQLNRDTDTHREVREQTISAHLISDLQASLPLLLLKNLARAHARIA